MGHKVAGQTEEEVKEFPEHLDWKPETPRQWVLYYAIRYGNDWKLVDCIVREESRYNPKAQNPISTAGGLFQFVDSTWEIAQKETGLYGDKYDTKLNAELGNWLLKKDGPGHWQVFTNGTCQGNY